MSDRSVLPPVIIGSLLAAYIGFLIYIGVVIRAPQFVLGAFIAFAVPALAVDLWLLIMAILELSKA